MLKDFKAFIARGNVLDLAVAVIIGAAFGAVVTSAVNDIVMPPIGLLLGGVDFKDLFFPLNGHSYPTLAAAKAAAAPRASFKKHLRPQPRIANSVLLPFRWPRNVVLTALRL